MARFFPVRSQCQFDTPGVSRFAERREYDYFCRGIVPVGSKPRYHVGKGVEFGLVLRRESEVDTNYLALTLWLQEFIRSEK